MVPPVMETQTRKGTARFADILPPQFSLAHVFAGAWSSPHRDNWSRWSCFTGSCFANDSGARATTRSSRETVSASFASKRTKILQDADRQLLQSVVMIALALLWIGWEW